MRPRQEHACRAHMPGPEIALADEPRSRRTVSIQKEFWIDTEREGPNERDVADHRRRARRVTQHGLQRLQPAGSALPRAARQDPLGGRARWATRGPNPTARSLRSGKVNAIGVLLTDNLSMAFTDPYAVAYLRGLAEAASGETSLLLLNLPKDEAAGRRVISNAAVDAFCLYCVPDWHSALELVRSRGVPVVIGEDPQAFGPEASYVGIDERAAARRLGEHIVNLGHRDIAVVAHWIVDDGVTGPVDARFTPTRTTCATT